MIKNLLSSLIVLLLLTSAEACAGKRQEDATDVATARRVLDTPFYFLLGIPDYEPNRLAHDADLFSAWGHLVLARKPGSHTTRAEAREMLLKAARGAGWMPASDLVDVESPDLQPYGITQAKEDLAIRKTASLHGQNPPTRYGCRIWISASGSLIVAAFRVDGE